MVAAREITDICSWLPSHVAQTEAFEDLKLRQWGPSVVMYHEGVHGDLEGFRGAPKTICSPWPH